MDMDDTVASRMDRRAFLRNTAGTVGVLTATGVLIGTQTHAEAMSNKKKRPLVAGYSWDNVPVGGGGAVPGIILHPRVPNLRYIRTDVGGAYRWDESSARWIALVDWIPNSQNNLYGTESMAIDPTDSTGNIVYAALGTYAIDWATPPMGTIVKSSDRGRTWQQTSINGKVGPSSNWSQPYGERLAVDPNNGQKIYYASPGEGLWQSNDAAGNWQLVTSAPTGDLSGKGQWKGSVGLTFVIFDKNGGTSGADSTVIYLGAWNAGVYRSSDAGASWQLLTGSPTQPFRASIDANGILYVPHATGLAKYQNGSWSDITPPAMAGQECFTCATDPFNPAHLITARHYWGFYNPIYRSLDGGQSWFDLSYQKQSDVPWWWDSFWSASTFNIAFDPHQEKRVFYTDWYGTWSTEDISASPSYWITREKGHEEVVVFALKSLPSGAFLLSGVADVDGFRHTSYTDFPQRAHGNPSLQDTTSIDFAESNPNYVVRCGGNRDSGTPGGGAYSNDNGATWTSFASYPKADSKNGRVAVSAGGGQTVWIPMGDTPYVTTDNGATWQAVVGAPGNTVRGDQVWSWNQPLASDRVDGQVFYLYDRATGKFYRTNNSGFNWSQTSAQLPTSDWQQLEAVPGKAYHIWISLDGEGLWYSHDGGDSFTKIANVQVAHLHSFGKAASNNGYPTLFVQGKVNNQEGVFQSDNQGASWQQLDTPEQRAGDLPSIMAGDRQNYGRVYVGTNGRGILYTSITTARKK